MSEDSTDFTQDSWTSTSNTSPEWIGNLGTADVSFAGCPVCGSPVMVTHFRKDVNRACS